MPMWRCPHCGTPQAETARCWVCHRSSTVCGTCRHFRRSVAAQLGYCGLDRTRAPLRGDEIRSCWEAWPLGAADTGTALMNEAARLPQEPIRHLDFVEVGATVSEAADVAEATAAAAPAARVPARDPGWSLWGEPER